MHSRTDTSAPACEPWRAILRRHLFLLLAIKLDALMLLWAQFFSPAHRTAVDAEAAGRQLAVAQQASSHD